MSRDDLHFRLRLPESLKQRIEAAAAANNRSMTAEIVSRIEHSFQVADEWDDLKGQVVDSLERIESLEGEMSGVLDAMRHGTFNIRR